MASTIRAIRELPEPYTDAVEFMFTGDGLVAVHPTLPALLWRDGKWHETVIHEVMCADLHDPAALTQ